jgi:hypothetical protein
MPRRTGSSHTHSQSGDWRSRGSSGGFGGWIAPSGCANPLQIRRTRPRLCNSSKGKTPRARKILYSFEHKGLRDFWASCAPRIPARFVQHGPYIEGQSAPRRSPLDLCIMIYDLRFENGPPVAACPGRMHKQTQFVAVTMCPPFQFPVVSDGTSDARGPGDVEPVVKHRLDAPPQATKPNLGRMGHLGDDARARGQSCKTNPICRSGPRWVRAGGPHRRGLLSR